MENKEFTYQGKTLNGILMLVLNIIGILAQIERWRHALHMQVER